MICCENIVEIAFLFQMNAYLEFQKKNCLYFCPPNSKSWLRPCIQQLRVGYQGITSIKAQSMSSLGLPSPHSKDATNEYQQLVEASSVGRNQVQSMCSRDIETRSNSFSCVRKWASDGGSSSSPFINTSKLLVRCTNNVVIFYIR